MGNRMGSGDLNDANKPASTDKILVEAQRRLVEKQEPETAELSPTAQRLLYATNRGIFWLSRHWLLVFNILAFIYVGGAFLAPIMMHLGYPDTGNMIYRIYKPFCHQYPFRSWFLFGPEAHYPLEERISVLEMNKLSAFTGTPEMGYKVAFCQRDVGIYGAIFLGGLIYALLRKRMALQPLPIWLYLAIAILPMGLDGGIQWLSYILWTLNLVPQPYETTPLMRTLTGALFGLGAIGVAYPNMEEFFQDVRNVLSQRYHWS